jgi:iron(III) transport system permease protein
MREWGRRSQFTPLTILFLLLLGVFFGLFLFYPLVYVCTHAFVAQERFSLVFFRLMLTNPNTRTILVNSVNLALATTLATTLLSLPLSWLMVRYDVRGKGLLSGCMLLPMIMPPFVGAIGMRQLLARFGSVNLLLLDLGLINRPIDWLGDGGFFGIVVVEALHLYPILYLNLAAALANVDPSLEEAARNVGASGLTLFRTVTFPLLLPGYFAGAILVFIWALTDLGTPLIFAYRDVIAVQIFTMVTDIHENPMGYAFVVLVMGLTLLFFIVSKRLVGGRRYEMLARGHVVSAVQQASPVMTLLIYGVVLSVTLLALLPHMSVILTSLSERWFFSILPTTYTFAHYRSVFDHALTLLSIKNSLFLSSLSTLLDVLVGITLAYILARRQLPGQDLLDAVAMLPLALPGLVLAFGYIGAFSGTWLDARVNPVPLLIISYSVRRLPYMVRAAYAGLQQTSVTLEEASLNVGAGPLRTLYHITFPLVFAHLIAGAILSFAFAMLEVSDSLILALSERYYPITKAIYALLGRLADGPYIASAMGVLGMILLGGSLFLTSRFLGRHLGELFRA